MGTIIFLLVSLLTTVNIQLGMALGLFAVFGILRFRTVNYTAKDMTYIFTVIGISVINSQANIPPPVVGGLVVNSIIILLAIILELFLKKNALTRVVVRYNKLKLLNPDLRNELLTDLTARTGLNIEKVRILRINIGKGRALLEVFFRDHSTI
jgi:predicted membrane protein